MAEELLIKHVRKQNNYHFVVKILSKNVQVLKQVFANQEDSKRCKCVAQKSYKTLMCLNKIRNRTNARKKEANLQKYRLKTKKLVQFLVAF